MKRALRQLTLPLILLVTFNELPGIYLRPLWAIGFCSVLLAYRLWLHWREAPMPSRWILLIGQIVAGVLIWQHYFTLFGDEAAGTLLSMLTFLKLYELRAKRDYFITVLLCFLVIMTFLLLDQSLALTIFFLADVTLLLTYLFALEDERFNWLNWRAAIRPGLVLALKAVPLMVLIFILFPRFSTGFGTGSTNAGHTGVSDSLRPGSIGQLINSNELAFRATFLDGTLPPRSGLYWRAAVLDQSHGLNWDRSRTDRTSPLPVSPGAQGDIEIYLEPGNERLLFSLDNTLTVSMPNDLNRSRIQRRDGGVFELDHPLQTRERYLLYNGYDRPAENEDPRNYLQTDDVLSSAATDFLKKVRRARTSMTVREILNQFRSSGFSYSLQPPASETLDDFLFKNKVGFCEHFAGTMATLLRHAGISARVVVGFQGGTPSLLDNFITVRARDAHAWVEYYDGETGRWNRVDPTAEVEPQRIAFGSDSYVPLNRQWASWLPGDWNTIFLRSRALFDEIDARWIGFLIRFDLARQEELLAKLGMEGVLFRALPVFLILAIALMLAFLYFFEAQRPEPVSEEEGLYLALLRQLKRWRLEKKPGEGPVQLLARLSEAHAPVAARVEPILTELTAIRFGGRPLTRDRRDDLRRQLRRLKKLSIKSASN